MAAHPSASPERKRSTTPIKIGGAWRAPEPVEEKLALGGARIAGADRMASSVGRTAPARKVPEEGVPAPAMPNAVRDLRRPEEIRHSVQDHMKRRPAAGARQVVLAGAAPSPEPVAGTLLVIVTAAPPPPIATVREAPEEAPGTARAASASRQSNGNVLLTQYTVSSERSEPELVIQSLGPGGRLP
jgi:hypothetical protein